MDWLKRFKKTDIVEKAVSSYSGTVSSITPHLPEKVKLTNDPIKLMALHKGYIFAANQKISAALSSIPYHLYASVDAGRVGKMMTNHGVLTKSVQKEIATSAKINLRNSKKQLVEIYEHPFLDLMKNPAPGWSQTEFFKVISESLGLIGNCYVLKGVDSQGQLTSLTPLDSEYISIVTNEFGITKYDYRPYGCRRYQSFEQDQILHIRNRCAGSTIVGYGNAEACQHAFSLAVGAYQYQIDSLNNFAVPPGMWVVEGSVNTQEEFDKFREDLQSSYGGRNRGKPGVSAGLLKWVPTTSTMADAQIDKFMLEAKKEIAACFAVPLSCLDETNSNKATSLAAMQQLMRFGVFPKISLILDQINTEIVAKYYDSDLILWIDSSEILDADPLEQATVLATLKNAGIMSVNECRAVKSLPLLDGAEYDKPIAANASTAIQGQAINPTIENGESK